MVELPLVTKVVEEAVASRKISGAVVLVRHEGQLVHSQAAGTLDPVTPFQLRPDTLFWLASLSKVVGMVAVLMLAEEGRLTLDDPVSRFIPEFGGPGRVRTLRPGSPPAFGTPFGPPPNPLPEFDEAPASRQLTLFDLVTHTAGLQSMLLWNPEFKMPEPTQTLADYVPSLGGVVRDFQAGEGWAYSNSAAFDVVSRVIEIASGDQLEAFLTERVFGPLGIESFGFARQHEPRAHPLPEMFSGAAAIDGRTFKTTSAGLWGTPEDYLILAEMLRNLGEHDGTQLLQEETVVRVTTNQIGNLCPGINGRPPAPGTGMGLSVATIEDPVAAGESLPAHTFGWDGVGTRRFWVSREGRWSMFYYALDLETQRSIEGAVVSSLA